MKSLCLVMLGLALLCIGTVATAQNPHRTNFVLDASFAVNRSFVDADSPNKGAIGYHLDFAGLVNRRLTPRLFARFGLGLATYEIRQDRDLGQSDPPPNTPGANYYDMETKAIFLQFPLHLKYLIRVDERGPYLRAGLALYARVKEQTQFCRNTNCEDDFSTGYPIDNALRNGMNPFVRAGIGYQFMSKSRQFSYVELYIQGSAGSFTRSEATGNVGWANLLEPTRIGSIGVSFGGLIVGKGRAKKRD